LSNRIGFAYAYNVAGIDPQPLQRKIWARVAELREDFKKEDYERMLHYIAELELERGK